MSVLSSGARFALARWSGPSARSLSNASAATLFDARTKAKQRVRAALADDADKYDYLRDHMANQLVDRLNDIPRTFDHGLDLFCGSGHVSRALRREAESMSVSVTSGSSSPSPEGVKKVGKLSYVEMDERIVERRTLKHMGADERYYVYKEGDDFPLFDNGGDSDSAEERGRRRNEGQFDIVLSGGTLHWISDLPMIFRHVHAWLKPDGVFLACMLGGETLRELRISMQLAEDELRQRVAPRVSPMIHLRDIASLLSANRFALPTTDYERVVVTYPSMHELMAHLRGMGETNALVQRQIHYGRKTFQRAAELYQERFTSADDNTRIEATFDIMYLIGWKPSDSQPSALHRGSADVSLSELVKNK